MSIAGRITKLENSSPTEHPADPIILSWSEDPYDPSNWACALIGPHYRTVIKQDNETRSAFAACVAADANTKKADS